MRGVVFLGERELELREFPDPTPGPGEVVLEMKASGMCGSDLKFYRAPRGGGASSLGLGGTGEPVIAGHEPCGVVAEVGPCVPKEQAHPGMRVMCHHYKGCGVCNHCRVGWSQLCRRGILVYGVTANGGHARYMKVAASTLVPLPDELSFEVGAAIACGTGTAYSALQRIGLSGRETIAVFGQGPVGLSATQLAKAMGARVIALDVGEARLALARGFGADATINPKKDDPVQAIKDLTHGEGAELTLDCSGIPDARLAAVRSTRTWGKAGMVGEGDKLTVDVSQDLLRRQVTIIASWTFSTVGLAECARFIADRRIPVERLFTHRYRLDQAAEAYKLFDTQTTGKGVFLL
jgi:2-desacetyl-2-hydroxyethyl bacteriochlorophyllide A dehydrogenase